MPGKRPANTMEKFWSYVDIQGPSDCWGWTRSIPKDGRTPQFRINGKAWRINAIAFMAEYGEEALPVKNVERIVLDCGNAACVNIAHMVVKPVGDKKWQGDGLAPYFWDYVNRNGPVPTLEHLGNCWTWSRGLFADGYGSFCHEGVNRRAHRLAYEYEFGEIPKGLDIDHKCGVRECVRPSHLQAVSRSQNMQNQHRLRRDNTSGARGVSWCKAAGRYVAKGQRDGRQFHIGTFKTVEEASRAASAWRREHHPNSLMDQREEVAA